MSDQTPWMSAPLGGQPAPGSSDVDGVDDEEFHARLGGVPIERLAPLGGESRIDQLPPPPYPADPPVAAGVEQPKFDDPWAANTPSSAGWGALGDEPTPVSAEELFAAPAAANSAWDDLNAADPGAPGDGSVDGAAAAPWDPPTPADTTSTGVWADGAEAAVWDPPAPDAEAAPPAHVDGLDDIFDEVDAESPGPDGPAVQAATAPTSDEAPEVTEPQTPAPAAPLGGDDDAAVEATVPEGDAPVEPQQGDTAPEDGDGDGDLDLEDLFGDDGVGDAPAPAPLPPSATVKKWSPGVDRYEDPQIVYAAGRLTSHAAAIPDITNVTREFKLTRDPQLDAEQRATLEALLSENMHRFDLQISPGDYEEILDLVYDELLGLGPLGAAWRADEVTEILVDGWDKVIVEVGGELLATDMRFRDPEQARSIARDLAQKVSDRQLSPNVPLVTAKLDRARVNIAYGPVVPELDVVIAIRKFNAQLSMGGLLAAGALTPGMRDLLWAVVKTRGTVLVSGATGVGKTTLLSAAAEAIPYNERIITIEDAREISLGDRLSWVPSQTKEKASGDDSVLIEQSDLLYNSLRQRPDRLIVGEVRDGRTASVMLEAANTGHEGTMTTLHANSAADALNSRIVRAIRHYEDSPAEVIREEVADAFDLVLHGIRRNGRRFVAEICEVSPRYLRDGRIEPRVLWRGHVDPAGEVHFEHVAGLDPDGRNAERLIEAGMDPAAFDPV